MKILIDTDNKTIEIEGDITIADLIKKLSSAFDDWEEYKITATAFLTKQIKPNSKFFDPFNTKIV